jgi:hypothetical protein
MASAGRRLAKFFRLDDQFATLLRFMAVTHLLLRRADPGLLAYLIRRESRSGSELSLRNLGP